MPLTHQGIWLADCAAIRITTNVPVHLTMRYTAKEPVKTLHPKEKRGVLWYYDNKLCFVEWSQVDQDEAGDTLVHTFGGLCFPQCLPLWYYFQGTAGGAPSPSNTAIFMSHNPWPPPSPPAPCALQATLSNVPLAGREPPIPLVLTLETVVS